MKEKMQSGLKASVTWRFRDRSIGSRGMVDRDSFMNLLLFLGSSWSVIASLFCGLSSTALKESYSYGVPTAAPVTARIT